MKPRPGSRRRLGTAPSPAPAAGEPARIRRRPLLASFLALCLAAVGGSGSTGRAAGQEAWPAEPEDPSSGVLVLARVSNNPRKDYPALKTLADYLAAGLLDVGVRHGRVRFVRDTAEMQGLLRDGRADLVFDTVFPALAYEREAGAKLLLREWRDGSPTYRSVLFKRKDTPIDGLPDLAGRTLAFERAGSTSGYLVPRAELLAAGLRLQELAEPSRAPPPGNVGYRFAGSENNIVVWVHRRVVAAGAFSEIDWDQPDDMPPALRQDLEIFYRSAPLPRALVVARGDLPHPIERRVRRLLLDAPDDPAGAEALKAKHVARYDELVGEAAAGVEAARRLGRFGP